jgi:hypothetical protein
MMYLATIYFRIVLDPWSWPWMKLGVELFQLLCRIDSQGGGFGKTAKEVPCHVGPKHSLSSNKECT